MRARRLGPSASVLLPCLCFALLGCKSGGNPELLEAELRTKEFQLRNLQDEMLRVQGYNEALQREVKSLRDGTAWLSPEAAAQTYPLRTITLGRPTGGIDEDGMPGHEALQVFVEPRDSAGHVLKTPGTLLVAAQEVFPEGIKNTVSSWEVSGAALHQSWRSGLLSTGYSLVLPWKVCPRTEKVRVIVRFVLTDGRAFEAEKDITIRPLPGGISGPILSPAPQPDKGAATPRPEPIPPGLAIPPLPKTPSTDVPPIPFTPPLPRELKPNRDSGPPLPANPGTAPMSHWQNSRRTPLSEGVELLRPVVVPSRVEWVR